MGLESAEITAFFLECFSSLTLKHHVKQYQCPHFSSSYHFASLFLGRFMMLSFFFINNSS